MEGLALLLIVGSVMLLGGCIGFLVASIINARIERIPTAPRKRGRPRLSERAKKARKRRYMKEYYQRRKQHEGRKTA